MVLFLQKHRQGPQAQHGVSAHTLGMVQAQLFLAIAETRVTVPASRDVGEHRLRPGFPIAGSPVPGLGKRGRERVAHDHHLAAVPRAHAGGHDVDVHRRAAAWPERRSRSASAIRAAWSRQPCAATDGS